MFYVQMWHLLYKINWLNISELQDVGMWNSMILLLMDMMPCQWLIGPFIPLKLKGLYSFTLLGTSYSLLQHHIPEEWSQPTPLWESKNSCGTCSPVIQSTQVKTLYIHFLFYYAGFSHTCWPSRGRKMQIQKEKCYRRGLPL